MRNQKGKFLLALMLVFAMLLAACGNSETSGNSGKDGGSSDFKGDPLKAAFNGEFKGTKVTILGPFSGPDEVKFNQSVKSFEEKTGIDIQYTNSKEFNSTIGIRVKSGNPPDIADFPQPGALKEFAKKGQVVDVSTFLSKDYLKQQYDQSWIDISTMPGKDGEIVAGVWQRVNAKSFVWYPKDAFEAAGYEVPKTWDELMALTKQMADDGYKPWSFGIEAGAGTGWPATDWIENIMLRTTSLENYDKWVNGELPFTSDVVKEAFKQFSNIFMNDAYVYGGTKSIVSTNFGDAPKPLFTHPPKAFMLLQGNFITSFFPQGVTPEDFDFFVLPQMNEKYGAPLLVGGDIMAMFNDRPEVRAVMKYFTTGESLKSWIQSGGAISPHKDSKLSWYQDPVTKKVAEKILNADAVRFDGSDSMPSSVGTGSFWEGMTDYLSGTTNLEQTLKEIQSGFKQ
ncbi:MAG TPA: ABC transporter substrate-binding protein [Bacillales bacterium]|nr:ABC transporter substrate-binding protein [Bacillales bacterium]